MKFLTPLLLLLSVFALPARARTPPPQPAPKYNVLFIISDDLKCEPGAYGGRALTPNIDALARQGVRFDAGYCQFPLCNPSRSSMLTGRHPGATGIIGNGAAVLDLHPDFITLPRHFKQNGYATLRSGKIFHEGFDDAAAWTEGGEARGAGGGDGEPAALLPVQNPLFAAAAPAAGPARSGATPALNPRSGVAPGPQDNALTRAQRSDRWLVMPGNGESDGDYQKTTRAIELLRKYKDQRFFMGFGLSKPHSPLGAPQKFYDLYPLDKIDVTADFAPRPTVPEGFPRGSIRPRNADLFIGRDATVPEAKEMIRAYLASTSYMDSNVGRILAELDALKLRENTIVIFWGDHGYQLGEKGKWSKAGSLFEEGARTPFIIAMPGAKANGQATARAVQAIDFYPTLVELCALAPVKGLEGRSLTPLLNDTTAPWDHPAYTIWSEDGTTFTGISLRLGDWRYAEFTLGGPLLFDLKSDRLQTKNLATDPAHAAKRAELAKLIQDYRDKHGLGK